MMTESSTASPRSRPKGDKRERTRATLLEAARALIREKGYEHTTLEDIAERAGMTTGAIYGNFKNRNDLFLALGQAYWPPVKPKVKAGASFADVITDSGFSWPSTVPCCNAVKTSVNAIGVGMMPNAR